MTPFFLVFFILTLLSNIALFVLAILLFRQTKEFMQGWRYMAYYGLALSLMSFFGVFRVLTEETELHSLFIFLIGISSIVAALMITTGSNSLLQDIGYTFKFWTRRNAYIVYALLFVVLALSAWSSWSSLLAQRFYTAALYIFTLAHFVATSNLLRIARTTKKSPWKYMTISAFLAGLGILILVYTGTCCALDGVLFGSAACGDLIPPFATLFPQWCSSAFVTLNKPGYGIVLIATLLLATGYFLVCKQFFGMFKGRKK